MSQQETVAKAELHVHLEGTAPPSLLRHLAERHGTTLPEGIVRDDDSFAWNDFLHFLQVYDRAASLIRDAQDYRDVTYEYLAQCAREGAVYVELLISPDHAAAVGLDDAQHVAGIAQGIDDARAQHGIEARMVAVALRHLGPDRAERIARWAAGGAHPYLVGLNLVGDEAGFPPEPFAPAFAIAAEAGLGCSVHAGEHSGPASVRGALELPGVTRISHGVRAIEDPRLVERLAERGTVLEVCPTSNVALGVFSDYAAHPLGALRDAGVRVTLGSDDPPYFDTTIGREYAVAGELLGVDALPELTATAIDASFGPPPLRQLLRERAERR